MTLCPHHWKIGGVSLNSKLWTAKILAEQPELIKQVHKNYFKAGADIILFETVPSLKEAKVEAEIAEEYGYDYWISFSCLSEILSAKEHRSQNVQQHLQKDIPI